MKPSSDSFEGKQRPIKFETVCYADGTTLQFGDTDQVCLLKEETVASFADTGQSCFVRLKFEWPSTQSGVSKNHKFGFLTWQGGAAVARFEMKGNGTLRIQATQLSQPQCFHGLQHFYRVDVFNGDTALKNLRERFYFPSLPLEVGSFSNEKPKLEWLANCIVDLLKRERQMFADRAAAQELERQKKFPSRLPHENPTVDHYKNQQEVLLNLLRLKWPRFSKASKELSSAKTEQEAQEKQAAIHIAYIADYTAVSGHRPDVEDEIELWRNDTLIRLLSDALNDTNDRVDKRDWQLACGWIEKNYYRMNDEALEEAFNKDWNYKPKHKGNTLAKRARNIGLKFALKRGRPENPNSLPVG